MNITCLQFTAPTFARCRVARVVAAVATSIHANPRFIGKVPAILHVEMRGTLGLLLLAIASSVSAQPSGDGVPGDDPTLLSRGKLHFYMMACRKSTLAL